MDYQTRRRSRRAVSMILLVAFLAIGYWLDRSGAVGDLDQTRSGESVALDEQQPGRQRSLDESADTSGRDASTLKRDAESRGVEDSDARSSSRSESQAGQSQAGRATSTGEVADVPSRGTNADAQDKSPEAEELLYGLLREVSSRRYLSPQGLLYGPGSAEGHRLEHLKRHTKDDPRRRGSHGVFEGGMEGALQTIDTAYSRAKTNQRTTKEVDGDRTIYTVDLGKRIGYVGGSTGQRRGKPMARRVRLVLEGNYVVTAFPL